MTMVRKFYANAAKNTSTPVVFVRGKLDMEPVMLEEVCVVFLPSGENLISRFSFKEVLVKVVGRSLPVDLIVLEMVDNSMIMGMRWLSKYNATSSL